jgi:F-type H+-transporting ATPase subunit delta
VRSAVDLNRRPEGPPGRAISRATGKPVDLKVVIDPTVLGGLVTTVGDTVIDGSIKTRLEQLKHAL